MIKVQIINKGHQPLPAFATPQSAGMALRANIDEAIVLHPMERRLVPTGLYMALPAGYEAQIRPRSGLALKHGIFLSNGYFGKSWIGPISQYPIQNISIFNMCRLRTAQILGLMRKMVK